MKVLIFTNIFPLLSETFVLDHITALLDKGIEVRILSHIKPTLTKVHEKVIDYNLLDKTTYYSDLTNRIPTTKFSKILFYSKQLLFSLFHNPKYLIHTIKRFVKFGSFPFQRLYVLNEILPNNDFDIIHCHFCTNSLLALELFGSDVTSGRLVTSVHGYDLTKIIQEKGKSFYEELFLRGDLFLTVNNEFKSRLIDFGVKPEKIIVHHMGVDTTKYEFHPRVYGKKQKILNILSIGRLVEKKGFYYSITAFSMVASTNLDCIYSIIGDGPERAALEQLIQEYCLEDRVKILGWKTREEIKDYMRDSHLLIAPSITAKNGDQEGIPIVLMEAMAIGLPVISTLHSGIPELVQDGTSGFLVPEKDTHSISDKIQLIFQNTIDIECLCKNARKTVETNFNEQIQNKRLLELYAALVLNSKKQT